VIAAAVQDARASPDTQAFALAGRKDIDHNRNTRCDRLELDLNALAAGDLACRLSVKESHIRQSRLMSMDGLLTDSAQKRAASVAT